jgi:1-acyl-sn-glycerol-3-phosphate acyltransferase
MKKLPARALSGARLVARGAAMTGWTAGLIAAAGIGERLVAPDRHPSMTDRAIRRWARGTLAINRIETRVADPLPPRREGLARLVVCNHRSALDIPVLLAHFGGAMLSRHDVEDWPILGTGAKKANCIFVDRENPQSGARAIRAIRQRLVAGGTVNVFPEGTTYAGDEIREFSRGPLVAARGLEVELLPVALAYPEGTEFTEDEFGDHVANFTSRGRIRVGIAVGKPRMNNGATKKTIAMLRDDIVELVGRARMVRD